MMNKHLAVLLLFPCRCSQPGPLFQQLHAPHRCKAGSRSLKRHFSCTLHYSSESSADAGPDDPSIYARDALLDPPPPDQITKHEDKKGGSGGGGGHGGGGKSGSDEKSGIKIGGGKMPTKDNGGIQKGFRKIDDLSASPSYGYIRGTKENPCAKSQKIGRTPTLIFWTTKTKKRIYTVDPNPEARCFDLGKRGLYYKHLLRDMTKWSFNDGGYGLQLLSTVKKCNSLLGSHHEKKTDPVNKNRSAMYIEYAPAQKKLCLEEPMAYVFRPFVGKTISAN